MDGGEVTFVYLIPAVPEDGVPQKKLVAFKRTNLSSGGSTPVTITIESERLMYTSDDGMPYFRHGGYTLAAGKTNVAVNFG